jgi:hypothetical protein
MCYVSGFFSFPGIFIDSPVPLNPGLLYRFANPYIASLIFNFTIGTVLKYDNFDKCFILDQYEIFTSCMNIFNSAVARSHCMRKPPPFFDWWHF